jgi:hypothetical protein
MVSGNVSSCLLAIALVGACGVDESSVEPAQESDQIIDTDRVSDALKPLPELVTEFTGFDSLSNPYRVVVRYDASIADGVNEFPSTARVISEADAFENGYTEELARQKADGVFDGHADLARIPGSYVIIAYALGDSPEPVGVLISVPFSSEVVGPSEGHFSPQASYATCHLTVDTYFSGCPTAHSFSCNMSGRLTSPPGTNDGVLQARRYTGSCPGGSTSNLNTTNYTINTSSFVNFSVSGYYASGAAMQCRIDPGANTACIDGQISGTIWF